MHVFNLCFLHIAYIFFNRFTFRGNFLNMKLRSLCQQKMPEILTTLEPFIAHLKYTTHAFTSLLSTKSCIFALELYNFNYLLMKSRG